METPLVCALSKYLCYCSVVCVSCCVVSFDLTVSGIAGAGGEQFILYFHSFNFIVWHQKTTEGRVEPEKLTTFSHSFSNMSC